MESHRSTRTVSSKTAPVTARKSASDKSEDITALINPLTGAVADAPSQQPQKSTRNQKADVKHPTKPLFPSAVSSKLLSPVL